MEEELIINVRISAAMAGTPSMQAAIPYVEILTFWKQCVRIRGRTAAHASASEDRLSDVSGSATSSLKMSCFISVSNVMMVRGKRRYPSLPLTTITIVHDIVYRPPGAR